MAARVAIDFRILTDPETERWTPLDALSPAEGLTLWTAGEQPTCCTAQAAFAIHVDGERWNADAMDEIRMAGTWLPAIAALLAGECRAQVWAWEESGMILSRRGEVFDALDVHHSEAVVCPRVTLPLRPFARELATAASAAARWLAEVRRLAALAGADALVQVLEDAAAEDWPDQAGALLEAAEAPLPAPPAHDPGPLPETWIATLMGDRGALLEALAVEGAGRRVEGATLLHLAVRHGWRDGVRILLAAGADLRAEDASGSTPLREAARRHHQAQDAGIIADLRRAGAVVDPISACLLEEPAELAARSAEGVVFPDTMNWWVSAMIGRRQPVEDWIPALREAVAAGTPACGTVGGSGGWYRTAVEAAEKAGRQDLVEVLERLDREGPARR